MASALATGAEKTMSQLIFNPININKILTIIIIVEIVRLTILQQFFPRHPSAGDQQPYFGKRKNLDTNSYC